MSQTTSNAAAVEMIMQQVKNQIQQSGDEIVIEDGPYLA